MSLNASFASQQMTQQEFSQLVVFYFWQLLTIRDVLQSWSSFCSLPTQTQSRCVDAEDISISHRSPKLALISVGVDRPCWRRPHVSSSNFTMTGPIFLLVLKSPGPYYDEQFTILCEYETTSFVVLISTSIGSLLQNPPTSAIPYAEWINCRDITCHDLTGDARSIQIFLRICM